jgi:hypothetical protein
VDLNQGTIKKQIWRLDIKPPQVGVIGDNNPHI